MDTYSIAWHHGAYHQQLYYLVFTKYSGILQYLEENLLTNKGLKAGCRGFRKVGILLQWA